MTFHSAMDSDRVCEYLEWDSSFFGLRIARSALSVFTLESIESLLSWCEDQSIECLYVLAPSNHQETVRILERKGFGFVDIRLTLTTDVAPLEAATTSDRVRRVRPGDIPILRGIARRSHRDSRFYADPQFPEVLCDALYERWIEVSCEGAAEAVFVSEWQEQVAGYISCHLQDGNHGQIGLLGVDETARGRGLGGHLVKSALSWFGAQGVRSVSVVTQGRNTAAQRLYQRLGFVTASVTLWYHKWFDRHSGSAR
jgi:dTDP-4-amino-4,6-dideoxy-D-galactose acyltransferase